MDESLVVIAMKIEPSMPQTMPVKIADGNILRVGSFTAIVPNFRTAPVT